MDYRLKLFGVFCEPQVAVVGEGEAELRANQCRFGTAQYPFADHGKAMVQGETDGFVKLWADLDTGEILGGLVTGPEAVELIHEIVMAMKFRCTVGELARLPRYHPSLFRDLDLPGRGIGRASETRGTRDFLRWQKNQTKACLARTRNFVNFCSRFRTIDSRIEIDTGHLAWFSVNVLKQIINQDPAGIAKVDRPGGPANEPLSPAQPIRTSTSHSHSSPMSASKNILSNDVEIIGNLKFSHDLIIDAENRRRSELGRKFDRR